MARLVPLTKGAFALVDDADYSRLAQHKWLLKDGRYAARQRRRHERPGSSFIYMHREVLGDALREGCFPDHVNGDTLDNRRANLRAATHSENMCNRRPHRNGVLGYKGIRRVRSSFCAHLMKGGRRYYSRLVDTAEAAARLYDEMAIRLHGEFARLNFPNERDERDGSLTPNVAAKPEAQQAQAYEEAA